MERIVGSIRTEGSISVVRPGDGIRQYVFGIVFRVVRFFSYKGIQITFCIGRTTIEKGAKVGDVCIIALCGPVLAEANIAGFCGFAVSSCIFVYLCGNGVRVENGIIM